MNKIEKAVTMIIAIGGGFAGLWGAYTAHDASKFKQPFDEHDEISKSFISQISSAEKRNDNTDVIRVRLIYEKFEERWRTARQIAKITAPFENLATYKLSSDQRTNLTKLLATILAEPNAPPLSTKTLGAAYLALGDYKRAAEHLSVVSSEIKDINALALKAAAFGGLATSTNDTEAKSRYEVTATESLRAAFKESSGRTNELYSFAEANPDLKAIFDTWGPYFDRKNESHENK
ncbi:MAG: hypothetical protein AABY49_02520 [Planctomycetota bacterium]